MHYNVKRHLGRRFIGSCRESLASHAKQSDKKRVLNVTVELKTVY